MKGIILVGGPSVGTRFRPLSLTLPKPLFPIAGKAMISHHVEALSKIPGMQEIFLIGFFDADIFEKFIDARETKVPLRYLREYQALGTGGCLLHFRDEILKGNPDKIFVMNADICCSFPFDKMLDFHQTNSSLATLLSIRMAKSELSKYGCVVVDEASKKVLHFVEKPETFISDLISCGVYLFDAAIFDTMQTVIKASKESAIANGIEADSKVALEKDILAHLASLQKLDTFIIDSTVDFWRQIKTGSSVIPANRLYLQHFQLNHPLLLSSCPPLSADYEIIPPVLINPSATIEPGCKIGPNVCIGPRVRIAEGTRIINSIILDSVQISHDACIINAVIGWESKIGCWARVEGSPEDATHLNATYKGLKIPTATILGKDVSVAEEVVVRNCIVLPHKELRGSFHNEVLM